MNGLSLEDNGSSASEGETNKDKFLPDFREFTQQLGDLANSIDYRKRKFPDPASPSLMPPDNPLNENKANSTAIFRLDMEYLAEVAANTMSADFRYYFNF
jgi:hypothetical protein